MKAKCEMFGCKERPYKAYQVAPGTLIELCKKHYEEESKDDTKYPLFGG